MLTCSAESLYELLTEEEVAKGYVFPVTCGLRDISEFMAAKIIEQANNEGHLGNDEVKKEFDQG